MKLYSQKQLVLFCVFSAIFALFLGLGLSFVKFPFFSEQAMGSSNTKIDAEKSASFPEAAYQSTVPLNSNGGSLSNVQTLSQAYNQDEKENIDVYERFNEGVVNITTEVVGVNWFLEPVPQTGGSGSGSIIDTRGYVLTNNHVVKDAYKVFINLADGTRIQGTVKGTDPENDLAIVQFDPPKGKALVTIPFGESSGLKVGQKVLAIGNPFALERTLTRGIVSGLGRPVQSDTTTIIQNMIQTDASINPGNSGGPLLNTRGEMIGVNTMIYSPSGGSVGIGFAVPINTAKRVVSELIQYGMVKRGWIDITMIQLFPALVEYMKENGYTAGTSQGILISEAKAAGNADRAGLKGGKEYVRYGRSGFYIGGDILTKVDGRVLNSLADFYAALEDNKPGDRVDIEYYRNGKLIKAAIVLSDRADVRKTE